MPAVSWEGAAAALGLGLALAAAAAVLGLSGLLGGGRDRAPDLTLPAERAQGTAVRFVCLSDTHGRHEAMEVPDGDVLVHTGDFTNHGTLAEARAFHEWLARLPHPHKIVVPGNHELCFDREWYEASGAWRKWHAELGGPEPAVGVREALPGATVLLHEAVEVRGGVRVFGSPFMPVPSVGNRMAYNREPEELRRLWAGVEGPVDVLLTHSPPLRVLDRMLFGKHMGCAAIRDAARRLRPRFHVFGHVHNQYGTVLDAGVRYINAAAVAVGRRAVADRAVVFDVPVSAGSGGGEGGVEPPAAPAAPAGAEL